MMDVTHNQLFDDEFYVEILRRIPIARSTADPFKDLPEYYVESGSVIPARYGSGATTEGRDIVVFIPDIGHVSIYAPEYRRLSPLEQLALQAE